MSMWLQLFAYPASFEGRGMEIIAAFLFKQDSFSIHQSRIGIIGVSHFQNLMRWMVSCDDWFSIMLND